jgi:hypothetical protein
MFQKLGKIFAISMGNHMNSCREDVKKMQSILAKLKINCIGIYDCNPQEEILKFTRNIVFHTNDLLIVHYSGHGDVVGKKIKNKIELISTWKTAEMKNNYSVDIDNILSNLNCRVLLISDSCYSGRFGDFYTGKQRFLFIGSSTIANRSSEYLFKGEEKTGVLVNFFEYILSKEKPKSLSIKIIKNHVEQFFKEKKIQISPTVKYLNG